MSLPDRPTRQKSSSVARQLGRAALGVGAIGVGCVGYAALYGVRDFQLRRFEVPILPKGARPIRVLHISDLHLTPGQRDKQLWISKLAALEPDLVVNTGDNLSHAESVPFVTRSLGRLLDVPGVYVWGSNDYYAPQFKNPVSYLTQPKRQGSPTLHELPWPQLRDAFNAHGWTELTNAQAQLKVEGLTIAFRGTDDAHLNRDDYAAVAGPVDSTADVTIGVTHAPYLRVLDAMASDGHDLILAGHTHGGQVCVPFYGALVTNCDLDAARVKGLSSHTTGGHTSALHVSGGLGTSPYAPVRFACPPEATLLTLTAR